MTKMGLLSTNYMKFPDDRDASFKYIYDFVWRHENSDQKLAKTHQWNFDVYFWTNSLMFKKTVIYIELYISNFDELEESIILGDYRKMIDSLIDHREGLNIDISKYDEKVKQKSCPN